MLSSAWRTLRTPGMGVVPLAMHQAMATCESVVSGPCCCATSFMASSSPGHPASFCNFSEIAALGPDGGVLGVHFPVKAPKANGL
eukprot:Skav235802  [mRNA]  locus=scaffold1267:193383:194494:+ [translate_table: standard]